MRTSRRAHDIPTACTQAFNDLLADVVVREQREAGHYLRCRLRYSARSRSYAASQRSLSR